LHAQVLETALTLTALPAAPDGFEVGSLVEVQHQDEGLLGAWSMGVIVCIEHDQAQVAMSAFDGDEECEWFEWACLRPSPPAPPGGETWATSVKKGDHVDLKHEGCWWEMEVSNVARERLSRAITFTVYSVVHGDEHEVSAKMMRPCWTWRPASKQWHAQHTDTLYSAASATPLDVTNADAGGLVDALAFIERLPRSLDAGESLKFSLAGRPELLLPDPNQEASELLSGLLSGLGSSEHFEVRMPTAVAADTALRVRVRLKVPPTAGHVYVMMPPGTCAGDRFSALLQDGREMLVTAPVGLTFGQQMLIRVPELPAGAADAPAADSEPAEEIKKVKDKAKKVKDKAAKVSKGEPDSTHGP
jgi:hypothetical protein